MVKFLIIIFSLSNVNNNHVQEIREELLDIREFYEENYSESILSQITKTLNLIDKYEENHDDNLLLKIESTFDIIQFTHSVVLEIEESKEAYGDRYFKLWNEVFYLKKRVDNLYENKKVQKNYQLNIEKEVIALRKKHIYNSYQRIYDNYLGELKNTNECDYSRKIDVLIKTKIVLEKCEKLLFREDTKEIEKELRKTEAIDELEKIILKS